MSHSSMEPVWRKFAKPVARVGKLWRKVTATHVWDPLLLREMPIVTAAKPKVPAVKAKPMPKPKAKQGPAVKARPTPKAKSEETKDEKEARMMRAWSRRPWKKKAKESKEVDVITIE